MRALLAANVGLLILRKKKKNLKDVNVTNYRGRGSFGTCGKNRAF